MYTTDFPRTARLFNKRFGDEDACIDYLTSARWPNGFICPHCGFPDGWQGKKNRERWDCANRECGKITTLRSGTILHNSSKPLAEWMLAFFWLTTNKQSISAIRLQWLHDHGSFHTPMRWLREIRRAMSVALDHREKLGPIVELDEAYLGGVDEGGKRGRGSEKKTAIVGVAEANYGCVNRARFKVIQSESAAEIKAFLEATVAPGAIIKTDASKAHLFIYDSQWHADLQKVTEDSADAAEIKARKKAGERQSRKKAQAHLPHIHRVFSLMKRVVIGAHQGSFGGHLQLYLDEYCFKYDGRGRLLGDLTQELVTAIVQIKAVPYWKSCGRIEPRKPTRKQSRGASTLAAAIWGRRG